MRVGSEAVGGTPFDAAGPKGAGTTPGDASGVGAGFFALLSLLQAGAVPAAVDAPVGDAVPPDDASDEEGEAETGSAGASTAAAAGDVVVTLSGAAAVAVASAAGTPKGAEGGAAATGTPAGGGGEAVAGAGALSDTAAVASVAHGDPQPGAAVPAADDGGEQTLRTEPARAPDAARASVAQRAPEEPAGAAGANRAAPVAPSGNAGRNAARVPEADAGAIASVPEGSSAPQVHPDPAVRRAPHAGVARVPAPRLGAAQDAAPADDPASDGRAEHRGGAHDAIAAPRPASIASAERMASNASLEPVATAPAETGRNADLVPVTRDTSRASEGARRPDAGAQRAALDEGASLPGWIERLTGAQRLATSRRSNALLFDLEPAGLGRIEVRLSFGRDGVRAQVFTEHDHTRALIANQQTQLAAAFERNDVRLSSFLVDLGLGGEGSGEARREAGDPRAFDLGLAGGVLAEREDDAPAGPPIPTGLLSVRA